MAGEQHAGYLDCHNERENTMIDYPHKWDDRNKALLAKSLFYIYSSSDYNLAEFIKDEMLRLDRINRSEPDDILLRQRQGACQVLDNLLRWRYWFP